MKLPFKYTASFANDIELKSFNKDSISTAPGGLEINHTRGNRF